MTTVPKDVTIAALADEWAALDTMLSSLEPSQWTAPSPLPGWDVQANVAHIIGTESMLLGVEAPEFAEEMRARSHVNNDIGAFNERWVAAFADRSPEDVLDEFRSVTARRLDDLRSMSQEKWDAVGFTPAGTDTYGRFMRIRVFDSWMHELDIRDAVGLDDRAGGDEVVLALDEMATAMGFVVGKRAGAPRGSSVTFDLTGTGGRRIHVRVDDRANVVDHLDEPATATLSMPVGVFARLAGGRMSADIAAPSVEIAGDADLAARVLAKLNYTI
jgi:uncharacterized protein (TIGR03083 family)